MGFQMEKFGAEEMEIKLFLFAVLQIRLFSPWCVGRGLLRRCVGETEGPRLFHRRVNDAEAWPNEDGHVPGAGGGIGGGVRSVASSCAGEPPA